MKVSLNGNLTVNGYETAQFQELVLRGFKCQLTYTIQELPNYPDFNTSISVTYQLDKTSLTTSDSKLNKELRKNEQLRNHIISTLIDQRVQHIYSHVDKLNRNRLRDMQNELVQLPGFDYLYYNFSYTQPFMYIYSTGLINFNLDGLVFDNNYNTSHVSSTINTIQF